MKDTQHWISIVIGIGYIIFKIIRVIGQHKVGPVHQPDWEDKTEETLPDWEEIKWPIKEAAKNEQEAITSISETDASTNKPSKSISDPTYPGIQKLLLSTQNQNPYKFYQTTTIKRGKKLSQILNKYSTVHKTVIMAELFRRKTSF